YTLLVPKFLALKGVGGALRTDAPGIRPRPANGTSERPERPTRARSSCREVAPSEESPHGRGPGHRLGGRGGLLPLLPQAPAAQRLGRGRASGGDRRQRPGQAGG